MTAPRALESLRIVVLTDNLTDGSSSPVKLGLNNSPHYLSASHMHSN
jgi:hypothetical protein